MKYTDAELKLAPKVAEVMGPTEHTIEDCLAFLRYETGLLMQRRRVHGRWWVECRCGLFMGHTLLEALSHVIIAVGEE
jgi:hypothetical protein